MWRIVFYLFMIAGLIVSYMTMHLGIAITCSILTLIGLRDIFFSNKNILINYPLIGHIRYFAESIRPMIHQYFISSNLSDTPFNREQRELVYHRSEYTDDHIPFGTQRDITAEGYDFALHSLNPKEPDDDCLRIKIGEGHNSYLASRMNISALSFGALSHTAIQTLNLAAKIGNFAHNTGEGGLSPYHLQGGDLIWQIGTAYFGCRQKNGDFDPVLFAENALRPEVKMIEIKLSQGAKPSHGGILPAEKITPEIAKIRNIPLNEDCVSPPTHKKAPTPLALLEFVQELRTLSGGKPVGFKLCLSKPIEFMSIIKAMLELDCYPDFITIDGAEGGTGAAPLEFANRLGMPINNALVFANNIAIGANVRDRFKIIASGKVVTGFDIIQKLALGANAVNAARSMMFALGCIQSLRCHTNHCPTGIATQDPRRSKAVKVHVKKHHVYNFHSQTLKHFQSILGALGHHTPEALSPNDIYKVCSNGVVMSYQKIITQILPGELLQGECGHELCSDWQLASAHNY